MLSERVKNLRFRRGLTQEALAKRARITNVTVAKLESGANRNPTLNTLKKLARALGVPIAALIS